MPQSIEVKVKPNARRTVIISEKPNKIEIAVAAPAEGGKANIELIRFLEKKFGKREKLLKVKQIEKRLLFWNNF